MENAPSKPKIFRFGTFTLDSRTGELSGNGTKTRLRDQTLQLLLALLEKPGELLTREDLIHRLWPAGTFVDFERGLNKIVLSLREALGDSAENPQFVETLPRKGYRFIAPIVYDQPENSPATAPNPPRTFRAGYWIAAMFMLAVFGIVLATSMGWMTHRSRQSSQISALAVIPLENLSHDPEQEYFADGMTDELITDLAKMVTARMASRTSVMRYKGTKKSVREIGSELGVDAIVEGTVTRSGDRVRITAQLIQTSTDMHLWAETYERDASEVLSLQRQVATDIASRVSSVVKPLDQPRRVSPDAYGHYLKGRDSFYRYTDQGWQQAIEHFNRAVEVDPDFAPAYSGLADAYLVAGAYGAIPAQEALTQGKAAAAKALSLDNKLASAHYALATAYTWYDWNWVDAEKEFRLGLALNPNDALGRNWHGGYLSVMGRHEEAIDEHERARELDPLSLIVNANLARSYYWARRYDEAIAQAKATLQLDPKFGVALFWLEGSLRHKGMFKEAVALRQAVATPERANRIAQKFKAKGFSSLLREGGEGFKNAGTLVEAARCYAAISDKETAIALLEECYQRRCSSMVTLKAEPDFDGLRSDPRFQELVRRIGMP